MFVMAKISSVLVKDYDDCIVLRQAFTHGSQTKVTRAGTVLLRNVTIAANIRGEVIEAQPKRIKPRGEVAHWPRLRYQPSIGSYVDLETGRVVERARAIYMVGSQIFYLAES